MKTVAKALLIATVITGSLPTTVWAADPAPATSTANEKEGREHFLRGVDFSKDGDFRAALIEFRRAYDLAPNYRVLYNIGQTALELQEYGQSLDAFEKYLADGGTEIAAERRREVESEVKRLSNRVASVTIVINVPSASVSLDDIPVAASQLEHPIRVGAGRHKFSATAPDSNPASRVVDLASGETATVSLELIPTSRTAPPEPAPIAPARVETPSPSRTPLWVGIAVTGALAIGTAVVGGLALSKKSSFDDQLDRYLPSGNRSEIDAARSSLQTTALVFDMLAGATVVAGVTTLIIGLSSGSSPATPAALLNRPGLLQGTF